MKKKLALLAVVAAFFLGRHSQAQEAHFSEQFAFKVIAEPRPGSYILVPQGVQLQYRIEPAEESHPAPLAPKELALCRQYSEGGIHLFLRCGMDRYAVKGLALCPKKQCKDDIE